MFWNAVKITLGICLTLTVIFPVVVFALWAVIALLGAVAGFDVNLPGKIAH